MESAFFENSPIDFRLQKFINGLALASRAEGGKRSALRDGGPDRE